MLKEDDLNLPSTKTVEICHQSIIYSIDFHKILGLYSLNYQSASDYDFFMRAYNANLIANPQKKTSMLQLGVNMEMIARSHYATYMKWS